MTMFAASHKGKIVYTAGVPTGVSDVVPATVMDGVIGAFTGLIDGGDTFMVGTAKTVSEGVKIAAAAMATSKFTTGSFIPRKQVSF